MVLKFNKSDKSSQYQIKSKIFIGLFSVIVLSLLGFGGYFVYKAWFNLQNTPEAINTRINTVYDKFSEVSKNGGANDSQEYLDGELKNAVNKEEVAQIYIMKSAAADTPGSADKTKSFEYAYKAESIYPSYKSALIIANMEKAKGNNETALKYYKLCVERAPKDSETHEWSRADSNYYNKIIAELEKDIK